MKNNEAIVLVTDLSKIYRQGEIEVRALDGVSLTLQKGEFAVLAGPSGSGKTTLLNLIGALDVPTAGQIEIEQVEISKYSKSELSTLRLNKIGFIFQAYNLLPVLSAYENAEFTLLLKRVPYAERRKVVLDILKEVGLSGLENRRPNELSGGQQQRVAVARAICGNPSLVLADEPTANLDSASGEKLLDIMRAMNQERGITFLFSSHDSMVINKARRVIYLKDGKIVKDERRE